MSLPTFDEDGSCVKCGYEATMLENDVVGTRYCTGGKDNGKPCTVPGTKPPRTEHLERTCPRCGFAWAEAVLAVEE